MGAVMEADISGQFLFFAQFFGEPEHPFEGQFGRPSLNPRTGERQ
jgi:hypothetical protein